MAQEEEIVLNVKSDIGDVVKQTEKLDGATKKASKGVGKIGTAFKGMGTAIKAAGIGLVVALLAKLMEVFSKNQKVLDVFNTAMTALSIAFNDLFGFLERNVGTVVGYFKELFENPVEKIEELGKAITEGLYNRFIELLDVVGLVGRAFIELVTGDFGKALDTIKQAGKETVDVFTGVDESFDKVADTIVKYTTETLKQADAITQTAKAADRAAVQFAMLNAQYLKDAEVQRQIRDDETKTFAERIEANNKLNDILAEQQELQREQVQIGIDAAQQQYDINASEENFIALQEAKVAMLELEETITGQLSEQKTNAVALEKELLETQNEVRAEGLTGLERELEELKTTYELKKEMARKSGMDTTAITKQYEKDVTKIKKTEADKQKAIDKAVRDAKVGMAQSGLSLISAIAEEGSKIGKAAAVTSATISGIEGVQNAYTTAQKSPLTALFPGYPLVQAGLAGAFSAIQIQKILSGSPATGGGGGGGTTAAPQTPAPQMMSGAFELSGGVEPEPTRAYVVTDEMTNSQNQLANIRRRATI